MPELHQSEAAPIGPSNIGATRIARILADAPQLDDLAVVSTLRDAVRDYVIIQKAAGTPPECIIARVKTLVTARAYSVSFEARKGLLAAVMEWCLTAYYGDGQDDKSIAERQAIRADT